MGIARESLEYSYDNRPRRSRCARRPRRKVEYTEYIEELENDSLLPALWEVWKKSWKGILVFNAIVGSVGYAVAYACFVFSH